MNVGTKVHTISVSVFVLALILIQIIGTLSFGVQTAKASETKTIVVPDDFPTISAAIGNASQGDTILVKKGTYQENPVIDKAISIVGEEASATVVIGAGGVDRGVKPVFTITSDNVVLSGFTIRSANYSSTSRYATGLKVNANNITISGNTINGTYYGLFSSFLSSSTITNNIVTGAIKDGIRICGGYQNTISNNKIDKNAVSGLAIDGYSDLIFANSLSGNGRGIGLGASYSTFFGNNLTGNVGIGLLMGGSHNLIDSNTIAKNVWGLYLSSDFAAPNNNTIYRNNFVNNTDQVIPALTCNAEFWNYGSQGNYWSNYNGTDTNGDGIGDSPYPIYIGNVDNYPLMNQFVQTQSASPSLPNTPSAFNGTVSQWSFNEIQPSAVTPDSLDNNPIIVETADGVLVSPILVEGQSGNALRFNGSDYAYVSASPTLDIKGEFTIDAWVNVQQYKAVEYNIIIVECLRTQDIYPTRIFGFAFNGVPPANSSSPAIGALRGFFLDDKGVFNEVVTTQTVVPLNQWTHVVFARSLDSGMHIYVNDVEATVQATSGAQNPTGSVGKGSEFYIGHDSFSTLEDLSIGTIAFAATTQPTAQPTTQPTLQPVPAHLWEEWWFWTALLAAASVFLVSTLLLRKSKGTE